MDKPFCSPESSNCSLYHCFGHWMDRSHYVSCTGTVLAGHGYTSAAPFAQLCCLAEQSRMRPAYERRNISSAPCHPPAHLAVQAIVSFFLMILITTPVSSAVFQRGCGVAFAGFGYQYWWTVSCRSFGALRPNNVRQARDCANSANRIECGGVCENSNH